MAGTKKYYQVLSILCGLVWIYLFILSTLFAVFAVFGSSDTIGEIWELAWGLALKGILSVLGCILAGVGYALFKEPTKYYRWVAWLPSFLGVILAISIVLVWLIRWIKG